MLKRILTIALVAGCVAGLVATGLQMARLWPLILAAETYEEPAAAPAHGHAGAVAPQPAAAEPADLERMAFTTLFNLLAGFGFALVLNALVALREAAGGGALDPRRGLLWGLAGFAAFALAPALGLPPELPGMAGDNLPLRQAWWLGTAAATAGGLALAVWGRALAWRAAGIALMIVPHAIGAPHHEAAGGALPPALAAEFAIASLAAAAAFWLVLGGVSGWLRGRLA